MKKLYLTLCALFAFYSLSCTSKFVDTTTPGGVPNLVQFAPNMWRMGQPPDEAAWKELASRIAPAGQQVVVVKLDDAVEGNDDYAETIGWQVVRIPIPPEDDKVWTIFSLPDPKMVKLIVDTIITAHTSGKVVAWHCVHGRDRTGLISALVGMKLFGWTKDYAWNDMITHGFRWELPDLDIYWEENVP